MALRLRSQATGHTAYRLIAQEMASQVSQALPQFETFFKFVDYEGYDLGRLDQEHRKAEKSKPPAIVPSLALPNKKFLNLKRHSFQEKCFLCKLFVVRDKGSKWCCTLKKQDE